MARLARLVVPGLPHHVTQRGNRRAPTFFEDGITVTVTELATIGHGPNQFGNCHRNSGCLQDLGEQVDISPIVIVGEEHLLATVAPAASHDEAAPARRCEQSWPWRKVRGRR